MYEMKIYIQQIRQTIATPYYVTLPNFVAKSLTGHQYPFVSCYFATKALLHCVSRLALGPVGLSEDVGDCR